MILYLTPANGLTSVRPSLPSLAPDALRIVLDDSDREALSQRSSVKHARYGGFASVLGVLALNQLQPLAKGSRRAVLTTGSATHWEVAQAFGERLASSGARLVNPVMFPNTLPSATAVMLASRYSAHVCALSVDGACTLGRALLCVQQLFAMDDIDEALLFVHDEGLLHGTVGIAFLVTGDPRSAMSFAVSPSDEAERDQGPADHAIDLILRRQITQPG